MSQKTKSIWKWLDDHLEETLLMMLIVAITLLTGAQVVMRKLFQNPLTWSEELCRYCFMWTGFVSVGYCVRKRCAIRINTFVMLLSARKQLALEIFGNLISLGLYAVFLHASWVIVGKTIVSTQTTPAMGIPFYIIYLCTVLGFSFAVIRLIQVIVEDARKLIHPPAAAEPDSVQTS